MTRRPWQILVIACLVIACSGLSCSGWSRSALGWISSAAAQGTPVWTGPKTPMKLGVTGRPHSAFLMLALHRGYFDQHGIQIETVTGRSGNEFVAPLAQDRIPAASGSLNAALFNALNRGVDIRIVADFAHLGGEGDGLASIMARADLVEPGRDQVAGRPEGEGDQPRIRTRALFVPDGQNDARKSWSHLRGRDTAEHEHAGLTRGPVEQGHRCELIEPLVTAALRRFTHSGQGRRRRARRAAGCPRVLARIRPAVGHGHPIPDGISAGRAGLSRRFRRGEGPGRRHRDPHQDAPVRMRDLEGRHAAADRAQRPRQRC